MTKYFLFLALFSISFHSNAQIQISNFTYNDVDNGEPQKLKEFNGKIYFTAVNDGSGRELWSSDGTSTNTNLLIDIAPGNLNGLNEGVVSFISTTLNNELYFVANDGEEYSGGEIWKTDGTEIGSFVVNSYDGKLIGFTTVGSQIYFTIKTDDYHFQIWKTDGTQSGTQLVKDNIITSLLTFQGSVNNTFIFTIETALGKSKVWRSDGTELGTYSITGEIDGNGAMGNTSELSQYINFNNKLYFVSRNFLFETDGTVDGTNNVANLWNGSNSLLNFGDAIVLNGNMFFSFFSKDLKRLSIFKSDGTSNGTSEVYTATSSQYFYTSYLKLFSDNLVFASVNSNNGTSLFYLNGETNAVTEIIEIDPSPDEPLLISEPSSASVLTIDVFNDNLFFISAPKIMYTLINGWIFDTSSLTLTPVETLDNLFQFMGVKIVFNNDLYYSKNYQLWKFDTSTLGTISFSDQNEMQFYPNPSFDFIYFNKPNEISQIKIYDLNGGLVLEDRLQESGTLNIKDLDFGAFIIKIFDRNGKVTTRKLLKN